MSDDIIIAYHSNDHTMDFWQNSLAPMIEGIKLVDAAHPEAQEAEVIMAWDPPEGMIAGLKKLKGVISLAQGVDHILEGKTFPRHLRLARLIDPYMSEAMAEWVMLTTLEYHRDAKAYKEAEARKEWIRLAPKFAGETTIAVMGLGAIGAVVAQSLTHMKFNVIGWSKTAKTIPNVQSYTGDGGFQSCLMNADIIVSILPLTKATENIYNAETFAMMKKNSAFINAGRGKQVVEDDLIQAIDNGHLCGATLDVMVTEPLPHEHPFWAHPKIDIWPHVSAQTNPSTAGEQVADAIRAIRSDKDPINNVDIARGY